MKSSVGISNFLEEISSLYILLFSSISLQWSLSKTFLSLLAVLQNSAFKWEYLSFSPLPLASLLCSAVCYKHTCICCLLKFSSHLQIITGCRAEFPLLHSLWCLSVLNTVVCIWVPTLPHSNHKFVLYICESVLWVHFYHLSRFLYKLYDICFSLSHFT